MIDRQYIQGQASDQDDCELGEFVMAYHSAYAQTQDHRQAFNKTAMWALSQKKMPYAFWTSAKIIANDLESHALLFPVPSGLGFIGLTIGGLSPLYDMNPVFDPQKGWPGWKRLDAENR